ncbi:hypothetical protein [Salmonella phage SSBI34]|nr:hypothetical protein [Salmonella phage SSBI34]
MKVEFAKTSGGYLTDVIETGPDWVCPRKGEVVNLNGKNWVVEQLFHEIDRKSLIIYVVNYYE